MEKPLLSIVIPAHREAERILATLVSVGAYLDQRGDSYEIIVVDDGSTDGTQTVVEEYQARNSRARLLRHAHNRGKGAAVQTGMKAAQGRYALFDDADNATPIAELPKLLNAVERGADIAVGSRYLAGSRVVKKQSLLRRFMSRAGNMLFRIMLGLNYSDTRCGFKLFNERARRIVFSRQTLERWGFDTELLVIAQQHKLSVVEVPVEWYDRERGNIRPVRDSFRALQEILHILRMRARGLYD